MRVSKKEVEKNVRKWLRALRSGDYEQGRERLANDGKFCCLGVACEVFHARRIEDGRHLKYADFGGTDDQQFQWNDLTLPELLRRKLGLTDSSGEFENDETSSLTRMNDLYEATFDEIADLIESQPVGLFVYKKLDL